MAVSVIDYCFTFDCHTWWEHNYFHGNECRWLLLHTLIGII